MTDMEPRTCKNKYFSSYKITFSLNHLTTPIVAIFSDLAVYLEARTLAREKIFAIPVFEKFFKSLENFL